MKCVILAGGSGDALWPLSRKNYPKQFINIRKGRSLFQEAIARNLPFCDDFYIITNEKYRYIVEGQVQAFQGLSYQLFLEEMGRQTAPAVIASRYTPAFIIKIPLSSRISLSSKSVALSFL